MRLGALGAAGLALPRWLSANERLSTASAAGAGFGRARRCLLLFLAGGPPQLDTFDPQPEAPRGIRGKLRPIATRVAGVRLSELCPRLAAQVSGPVRVRR